MASLSVPVPRLARGHRGRRERQVHGLQAPFALRARGGLRVLRRGPALRTPGPGPSSSWHGGVRAWAASQVGHGKDLPWGVTATATRVPHFRHFRPENTTILIFPASLSAIIWLLSRGVRKCPSGWRSTKTPSSSPMYPFPILPSDLRRKHDFVQPANKHRLAGKRGNGWVGRGPANPAPRRSPAVAYLPGAERARVISTYPSHKCSAAATSSSTAHP